MAERITHLSIDNLFDGDHNHPAISRFIQDFSTTLYSGDGKPPEFLAKLGIGPDFPVRLLVGVPAKTLTREQRLVAEVYCQITFGRNTGDNKKLWQHGKGWRPHNQGRIPAPVRESRLDVEFMLNLGIPKKIWCNDILLAPTALDKNAQPREQTLLRYILALSVFGFSDPYQFFTRK